MPCLRVISGGSVSAEELSDRAKKLTRQRAYYVKKKRTLLEQQTQRTATAFNPDDFIGRHRDLKVAETEALHLYNDLKDHAAKLMGEIAIRKGCTIRELHTDYEIAPDM